MARRTECIQARVIQEQSAATRLPRPLKESTSASAERAAHDVRVTASLLLHSQLPHQKRQLIRQFVHLPIHRQSSRMSRLGVIAQQYGLA